MDAMTAEEGEGAPLKGTTTAAADDARAGAAAGAGAGDSSSSGVLSNIRQLIKRFWLSSEVRFISDAGAIICYMVFGSYIGYAKSCWIAGSVGAFGAFADFVRNQYDPW